jgi:hypothetical protein
MIRIVEENFNEKLVIQKYLTNIRSLGLEKTA